MEPPKDPQLLSTWVELAPPSMVAEWLSSLKVTDHSLFHGNRTPLEALQAVKARNDPFLDLMLALYGDDENILNLLWKMGNKTIQRGILSNSNRKEFLGYGTNFINGKEIKQFFNTGNLDDIRVLVTNQTFGRMALTYLFERKEPFDDLTHDRFQEIAVSALMNPNLHKEYEWEPYGHLNPERQMAEERTNSAAIRILFEVPAEKDWAYKLHEGFSRFPSPVKFLSLNSFTPPDHLFDDLKEPSWRDEMDKKDGDVRAKWKDTYFLEFLDRLFKRWTFQSSDKNDDYWQQPENHLRMVLTSKVSIYKSGKIRDWLENHQDQCVRLGAAKSKVFASIEEVKRFYEKDGWAFLGTVYSNGTLHERSNQKVVKYVQELLQDSSNAKNLGFDYEAVESIRNDWSLEAKRLYKESPLDYYSGNECLNNPDDIAAAQQEEPVKELLERLEQELVEISRTGASDQKHFLYAFHILSKTISALNTESSKRSEGALESILEYLKSGSVQLINLNGRSKLLVFLIIALALFIYFR